MTRAPGTFGVKATERAGFPLPSLFIPCSGEREPQRKSSQLPRALVPQAHQGREQRSALKSPSKGHVNPNQRRGRPSQPPPLCWGLAISCSQMETLSAPPPPPTQSPGDMEAALMKSIKEALFLTAVSWEGNWNNNKPSHLFKGLVAGTPPSALWEGSCPSAVGEMTAPIREIPFRTIWTGWEHPPYFTDD